MTCSLPYQRRMLKGKGGVESLTKTLPPLQEWRGGKKSVVDKDLTIPFLISNHRLQIGLMAQRTTSLPEIKVAFAGRHC